MTRTDLGSHAWVDYDEEWMPPAEATSLFERLCEDLDWEQRPIKVFGKEVMQPRLIDWAGELPYRYSGQTLPPKPFHPSLNSLMAKVSEVVDTPFNHVLLNLYRDGADNMGMHADDEWELGKNPTIAAVSLGAVRRFSIAKKGKGRKRIRLKLELAHGSLMVMGGTIQHRFWHGVPKQRQVETHRINITFRQLLGPPGYRQPRRPTPPVANSEPQR